MNKVMKILKVAGIVLLVLIVVLVLGRNFIVAAGAKIGVKVMTGLTLKMDKFSIGLLGTDLDIQGLKILNPKGYEDRVMLDLPRLYVNYSLKDLMGNKVNLSEVKFHLEQLMIVKRADGSSNLDGIKKLTAAKSGAPEKKAKPAEEKAKKEGPEIVLGKVEIKVGKFVSKSYSESGKPDTKEFNINIDKVYENKSAAFIVSDLSKYVTKILLQMVTNLNLGDVGEALTGTLNSVSDFGVDAAKKGIEVGKDAVDGATNLLKNTTGSLKNVIKLPFGNK